MLDEQYLIRFGYALFPVVSLIGIVYGIDRLNRNHLGRKAKLFVAAFIVAGVFVGLRIGWFVLSRMLAEHDVNICDCVPINQHWFFWENKIYMSVVTGLGWAASGLLIFKAVDNPSNKKLIITGLQMIGLAAILAIF